MSISQLARSIPASPTLAMNDAARRLREKGEAVVHLGGGEPKSKAPIDAILSASAKLYSAEVKYTPTEGTPAMRKAVVRYTEENYNRLVEPENIIISNGAKQALSIPSQSQRVMQNSGMGQSRSRIHTIRASTGQSNQS